MIVLHTRFYFQEICYLNYIIPEQRQNQNTVFMIIFLDEITLDVAVKSLKDYDRIMVPEGMRPALV